MKLEALKNIFLQNKPFTTEEAAIILGVTRDQASRLLYRYKTQGHLLKLKKGIYLPVPHKGLSAEETFADPWPIIPMLFPDSYVGGWSAANYYGLTEQLFNTTCLITKNKIHHKLKRIGRFEYYLFSDSIKSADIGQDTVWIEQVQVKIADIHRTVIDMLENPKCGGGIQHTIDCLKNYFAEHYNERIFLSYINHIKNGVFFKRLGYIAEKLFGAQHALYKYAEKRITKGNSSIDSSLTCSKLITRWHLLINDTIEI